MSEREQERRAEQNHRSYTISEWCECRRISRAMYYKLRGQGLAPPTHSAGTKQLISGEADIEWVRAREAETEQGAAA
jgi:hypothetical protein